jgi:hypothetical protein
MKYRVKRVIYFADLEATLNNPPAGYEIFDVIPFGDTEMYVVIWQQSVAGRQVQTWVDEAQAKTLLKESKKGASK